MEKELIFGLTGGLGLFFIGMRFMSEGLQRVSRDRLRRILESLTNNRVVAVLVGLGVTSIIQSTGKRAIRATT